MFDSYNEKFRWCIEFQKVQVYTRFYAGKNSYVAHVLEQTFWNSVVSFSCLAHLYCCHPGIGIQICVHCMYFSNFYVMGKALSGKLFCKGTSLVCNTSVFFQII